MSYQQVRVALIATYTFIILNVVALFSISLVSFFKMHTVSNVVPPLASRILSVMAFSFLYLFHCYLFILKQIWHVFSVIPHLLFRIPGLLLSEASTILHAIGHHWAWILIGIELISLVIVFLYVKNNVMLSRKDSILSFVFAPFFAVMIIFIKLTGR